MAITVNNAQSAADTLTLSYAPSDVSDAALIVVFYIEDIDSDDTVSGIDFGSTPMTLIDSEQSQVSYSSRNRIYAYVLENPGTAAQIIQINKTGSQSDRFIIHAMTLSEFDGVNVTSTTSPPITADWLTTSLTSTVDNCLILTLALDDDTAYEVSDPSGTTILNTPATSITALTYYEEQSTAGFIEHTTTLTAGRQCQVMMAVAPAVGGGAENYSGTATSTNTSTTTASGQKTSTGTATSTADDTTTTASFKTGLGNVTSINTASTVKTGLAIMLGTAISLNVAATTTTGTKSETATGTATSSNTATATTTGDKTGLGTATSNNTSTTTADGVQSGTGAGSISSTNTALTATTGSKSGLGLVSSVNGYLITLQSNAIMLGTATSSNTSESSVIGLSENDASGTLTSTSTSQTITAGNKIGLGDVDSANTSATTTTATTDREGALTSANTSSAIVSGANTAAPVIIRSVDLVCELPYILLTRAIDGSLFMAYPPEVSNITTAYQNNDTNINVVITDNGDAVSMGSITEAEYVIASRDKSQTYVSKSLGSGISKGSDQLVLSLSQADTSALLDIYYHELQITSDGKHATVFAEHINFIDTVI